MKCLLGGFTEDSFCYCYIITVHAMGHPACLKPALCHETVHTFVTHQATLSHY